MIQGKKINLRLIKEDDITEITKLGNSLTERGEYVSLELCSEVLLKKHFNDTGFWQKDFGKMLIISKTGNILGDIVFFKGVKECEGYDIGYQIYKQENRGKGYTTEALKLFSAYLFELKPINRLEICVFNDNVPSRRIAEKCGYVYEGTMRQAYFARGKYHDLQILSILREECPLLD
jgi:RimJ/RimL family protein N-acetyltransferase